MPLPARSTTRRAIILGAMDQGNAKEDCGSAPSPHTGCRVKSYINKPDLNATAAKVADRLPSMRTCSTCSIARQASIRSPYGAHLYNPGPGRRQISMAAASPCGCQGQLRSCRGSARAGSSEPPFPWRALSRAPGLPLSAAMRSPSIMIGGDARHAPPAIRIPRATTCGSRRRLLSTRVDRPCRHAFASSAS